MFNRNVGIRLPDYCHRPFLLLTAGSGRTFNSFQGRVMAITQATETVLLQLV
jgi:hypothetical protein